MRFLLVVFLILFFVPAGSLILQSIGPADDSLSHVMHTVLGRYFVGTITLMSLVLPGVIIVGAVSAWLVTRCDFKFRPFLNWALLLPFASPPYILAYVYTDAFQDYIPNIRSMPVAALLFTSVLYPYVYLFARGAFAEQTQNTLSAAKLLGCSPLVAFWRISLPLARPSIVAGAVLAIMEVASDFGTVEYFAIDTFSTGIYRTWFALGSKVGAARLALLLLVFTLSLFSFEKWMSRRARYFGRGGVATEAERFKLHGVQAFAAIIFCITPVFIGFLFPILLLLGQVLKGGWRQINISFIEMATRSFVLAFVAGLICVIVGLFLAFSARSRKNYYAKFCLNAASFGYALPGNVLAVGVLFALGFGDTWFGRFWKNMTGQELGLLLSGTIAALLYAYVVRFGAIPLQGLVAALDRVTPALESSARLLGAHPFRILLHVYLPAMRNSVLAAVILVFVDVVKELPATLLLRPFNFDTLAVHTYHLASDERLMEASPAALFIVLVGIIPVTLLQQVTFKNQSLVNDES